MCLFTFNDTLTIVQVDCLKSAHGHFTPCALSMTALCHFYSLAFRSVTLSGFVCVAIGQVSILFSSGIKMIQELEINEGEGGLIVTFVNYSTLVSTGSNG